VFLVGRQPGDLALGTLGGQGDEFRSHEPESRAEAAASLPKPEARERAFPPHWRSKRSCLAHLIVSDDGYRVEIELGRGDREIVDVLGAIAQHVRERDDGPARVQMSCRTYSVIRLTRS
jgi:hypothetical protein